MSVAWRVPEVPCHHVQGCFDDGRGQAEPATARGHEQRGAAAAAPHSALQRHDIMVMLGVYLTHKLPQEAFCQNFKIKVVTVSIVSSLIYLGDKGSRAENKIRVCSLLLLYKC